MKDGGVSNKTKYEIKRRRRAAVKNRQLRPGWTTCSRANFFGSASRIFENEFLYVKCKHACRFFV